jgi:hypothetical protein
VAVLLGIKIVDSRLINPVNTNFTVRMKDVMIFHAILSPTLSFRFLAM